MEQKEQIHESGPRDILQWDDGRSCANVAILGVQQLHGI